MANQLVKNIVEKLINFIKYNPDDLMNKRLLEKLINRAFSDTTTKNLFNEQLVNKIVEKLFNFIKYNPDDLMNRSLLEKIVNETF